MVRASLGRKTSLVSDVKSSSSMMQGKKHAASYPCYALPISTLLEMDKWKPHQDLLRDGELANVDELGDEANVIFLSSFMHPDPKNEQLCALQTLIRNLLDGGMSTRTCAPLEMGYKYHRVTGPAEWKALLGGGNGYIWLDYLSIPQPLAEKAKLADAGDFSVAGTPAAPIYALCAPEGRHRERPAGADGKSQNHAARARINCEKKTFLYRRNNHDYAHGTSNTSRCTCPHTRALRGLLHRPRARTRSFRT